MGAAIITTQMEIITIIITLFCVLPLEQGW